MCHAFVTSFITCIILFFLKNFIKMEKNIYVLLNLFLFKIGAFKQISTITSNIQFGENNERERNRMKHIHIYTHRHPRVNNC